MQNRVLRSSHGFFDSLEPEEKIETDLAAGLGKVRLGFGCSAADGSNNVGAAKAKPGDGGMQLLLDWRDIKLDRLRATWIGMMGFPSDVAELSCEPEHPGDGVIHSNGGVNLVCHFITCNGQTPGSILRGWDNYIWAFTAEEVWW